MALDYLDKDRAFLKAGGVFTDDLIDAYIELKMKEVTRLRMTTPSDRDSRCTTACKSRLTGATEPGRWRRSGRRHPKFCGSRGVRTMLSISCGFGNIWIALGLLFAAFAADAAVIYKWTDARTAWCIFPIRPVPGAENDRDLGRGIWQRCQRGPIRDGRSSSTAEGGGGRTPGLSSLAIESPAPGTGFFRRRRGADPRLHVEARIEGERRPSAGV